MVTITIRGIKTYQVGGEGQDRPKDEVVKIELEKKASKEEVSE